MSGTATNWIGKKVGRYEVCEVIGRGGMGILCRAHDRQLDRTVALKFLPESFARERDARQRFLREARSLAKLDHPHVPSVYEIDRFEDTWYIAFQFVEGDPLLRVLRRDGAFPVDRALRLVRQLAVALEATHARDIVHRDIKPENIMVGAHDHATLVDFGLAKPIRGGMRITRSDLYLGTPEYCSPEQIRGEDLDERSDLYSLGIVLYELLAGHPPFHGAATGELYPSILEGRRPPVRKVRPDVPRSLDSLLRKLVARDRGRRISTAAELVEKIDAVLASLTGPADSATGSATGKAPRPRGIARGPFARLALFAASATAIVTPLVLFFRDRS